MNRFLFFWGAIAGLMACNSTPESTDDTTLVTRIEEPAPVDLEERTIYEGDSTVRVVYQVDKNSDLQHGSYKLYDVATNRLRIERTYQHGKIEGLEKFYFSSGTMEATLSYKDGVQHGPFHYYYRNGQLKQEGEFARGKITGMLKSYYWEGQLKEEVAHVDGVTEGPFKEYNPNGTLRAEGAYTSKGEDEDLEHGFIVLYDENGVLKRRMACKQGGCCTTWTAEKGDVEPSGKVCEAIIEECKQSMKLKKGSDI